MAGIKIGNGTPASGEASVSTDGNLSVTLPTVDAQTGKARIVTENDPGGSSRAALLRSPETSSDFRLRIGIDSLEDAELFTYTNQNSGKHTYTSTTLTMDLNGGGLRTNATGITTINTASRWFTQRMFQMWNQQVAGYCEMDISTLDAPATNSTWDCGFMLPGAASPYLPTDGVYIRVTNTGWYVVTNFNTVEVATQLADGNGVNFAATINQVYHVCLVVTDSEILVWINDVLYAQVTTTTSQPQSNMAQYLNFGMRHAIAGVAAGTVWRMKLWAYSVYLADIDKSMPHGARMTGMGNGMQVQQGATTGGQLTTYALGAAPGAVTLTASTAPATNTLGGLFLLPAAITVAESDYPLVAWQNPAGTNAIPGKRFFVTGIIVGEAVIYPTALIGGPLIIQWAVGWGSTAASLATTETASFTSATTKIARKHPLGTQVFAAAAAVGTIAAGFQRDFSSSPLCINPGEFLHIIIRCQGVNTTGGTPRVQVTPIGHFE